jgi:hypothetical protein
LQYQAKHGIRFALPNSQEIAKRERNNASQAK